MRITCITFRHSYTCFMPSNPCFNFSLTECNTTVYAEPIVHAPVHLAPTRLVLVVCVTVGKDTIISSTAVTFFHTLITNYYLIRGDLMLWCLVTVQ